MIRFEDIADAQRAAYLGNADIAAFFAFCAGQGQAHIAVLPQFPSISSSGKAEPVLPFL